MSKRVTHQKYLATAMFAAAFGLTALPALAQKAKDTLRIGVHQPISIVDAIYDPQPQSNLMDRVIFDTLVFFDSDKREVGPDWQNPGSRSTRPPLNSSSARESNSTTDRILTPTMSSIPSTLSWTPTPLPFQGDPLWPAAGRRKGRSVHRAYKDQGKACPFLTRLITQLPILPSKYHAGLADKSQFGRTPIGTGPYKAAMVDTNKGVMLVRNPDFRHGGPGQPPARSPASTWSRFLTSKRGSPSSWLATSISSMTLERMWPTS